jgi:hypothetical protein
MLFYKAFYIEQHIIAEFVSHKYTGNFKFGGFSESFNNSVNIDSIKEKILTLFEEIQDRKPCELLETPEEDNQQPS